MVSTGFSAVIGSWKTMAMSVARILRIFPASRPTTFTLPTFATPETLALPGSSPMAAVEVTDLPDPDSPTSATTSPGLTASESPLTACTSGPAVSKVTCRLSKLSA